MNLTSPITGAAQTGLTSPTYGLAASVAPTPNGKQWYIPTLGGTQPAVNVNSVSHPFTISFFVPSTLKLAPPRTALNAAISGNVANWPANSYKLLTRKSVTLEGGGNAVALMRTSWDIPATSESVDLIEIKAMISAHIGALTQALDQWFETIASGSL